MTNFKFLDTIGVLPKMLDIGLSFLGTAEIPGQKSNAEIMQWARELGLSDEYLNDDVPWCGLFVALLAKRAGKDVVSNPLWARNWARWGYAAPAPMLGDVLIFSRGSGGHVGIYVAEDATTFYVLGGNQGNKVSITRILKNRLIAARRDYVNKPASVKKYVISSTGSISTDEA